VHNQPAEALIAYETTLKREPNRARTLHGAAQAARAAGQNDVARKYYGELVKLMDPTSTRPELREAKRSLGQ
jgi:Tfp pilus assembly protein PilF